MLKHHPLHSLHSFSGCHPVVHYIRSVAATQSIKSVFAQPVLKRISFGDMLSIVSFTSETSICRWSIGM